MTTGDRITNSKEPFTDSWTGRPSWYGVESRKVWSGGNSPGTHRGWNSYNHNSYTLRQDLRRDHIYLPGVVDVWKYGTATSNAASWNLPLPPTVDDALLVSKVASELRGHDFNALVAMGEGKETVELLTTAVIRIKDSLLALRGGNVPLAVQRLVANTSRAKTYRAVLKRGKPRAIKNRDLLDNKRPSLHESWLELQYGWKPLLQDVYEAYKSFFSRTNIPRVQYCRASSTTKADPIRSGPIRFKTWSNFRKRTVIIKLTEKHTAWQDMGLTDPATLAWELLPFSFVADWFIPIGTYLEARSFVNGSVGEIAFMEMLQQAYTIDVLSVKQNSAYYVDGGNRTFQSCSYSRSPFTNLASYHLSLPGFKPLVKAASLGHCLNALALLRGLTK